MEDDRSYYERRLREEITRAGNQADAGLRALHRRWAALYHERLAALGTGSSSPQAPANRRPPDRRQRPPTPQS